MESKHINANFESEDIVVSDYACNLRLDQSMLAVNFLQQNPSVL